MGGECQPLEWLLPDLLRHILVAPVAEDRGLDDQVGLGQGASRHGGARIATGDPGKDLQALDHPTEDRVWADHVPAVDPPVGETPDDGPPVDPPVGETPDDVPPVDPPVGGKPDTVPPVNPPVGGRPDTLPPGDANGDGVADVRDFMVWNANKFGKSRGRSHGDFNDDGVIDVRDFMVWNAHKFAPPGQQKKADSPAGSSSAHDAVFGSLGGQEALLGKLADVPGPVIAAGKLADTDTRAEEVLLWLIGAE